MISIFEPGGWVYSHGGVHIPRGVFENEHMSVVSRVARPGGVRALNEIRVNVPEGVVVDLLWVGVFGGVNLLAENDLPVGLNARPLRGSGHCLDSNFAGIVMRVTRGRAADVTATAVWGPDVRGRSYQYSSASTVGASYSSSGATTDTVYDQILRRG